MELRCAAHFFVLFLSFTLLLASTRADPHPLQDFCVADFGATGVVVNGFPCKPASNVTSDDFFFAGLSNEGNTSNIFGSSVTPANVLSFAGLNTLGVSMNRVDVAPGGVNPPHSHPRATELIILLKGQLLVGFVSTNNQFFSKVLNPGEMFVSRPEVLRSIVAALLCGSPLEMKALDLLHPLLEIYKDSGIYDLPM
ncbi:hypothetical protein C4D60_Mb04t18590 [Musa balbisiana]|uniref:Germin-like protein n=1 Tax=Musa balbisiana TaxID=52838 RepID=A0A4S8KD04_MUSBA|nr:hypothetical protein C4D60_Mb04t18590 [Musa balbisiana]